MLKARKLPFLFAIIFLLGVVAVVYYVNISLNKNVSEQFSTQSNYNITFISRTAK